KSVCPAGSLARARGGGSHRTPRCERIFFTAAASVTVATTRIFASHVGQASASHPNVRRINTAQSTREDAAKSAPPWIRFQCSTVMVVGSSKATAGVGLAIAGAFVLGGGETGCSFAAARGHGFDFLGHVAPGGGFGVTSARHEERAAKTP